MMIFGSESRKLKGQRSPSASSLAVLETAPPLRFRMGRPDPLRLTLESLDSMYGAAANTHLEAWTFWIEPVKLELDRCACMIERETDDPTECLMPEYRVLQQALKREQGRRERWRQGHSVGFFKTHVAHFLAMA